MAVPDLVNDNYVAVCCDGVGFKQMWIEFECINFTNLNFMTLNMYSIATIIW